LNTLAGDRKKTVVVFINDFYQEFADALPKLEKVLKRKLESLVLVDSRIKADGRSALDARPSLGELVVDFSDDAALRSALRVFEEQLLLVICSDESDQPYLQRILPFVPYILAPTESSLSWSTHKGQMRRVLELQEPSLVPKYQMIKGASVAELTRVTKRLKFPLIIKPTGLASSILVSRVETPAELREVAANSFNLLEAVYRRDKGRGRPAMIVEEFIVGDMYTVDAYVNERGQVWTLPFLRARTGHAVGHTGFYEYQSDSFTELTADQIAAGQLASATAIHALGLRSCVAHIELYLTSDGWKVIELGPRAGGKRQDTYMAAFGIDHALNELLLKVGLEPQVSPRYNSFASAITIYAEEEGTIMAVEGIEAARRNPSTYRLQLHAKAGDTTRFSTNGGQWLARVYLSNPDRTQLELDTEAVRSQIKFKTSTKTGARVYQ
jgi:biotin carboxylase